MGDCRIRPDFGNPKHNPPFSSQETPRTSLEMPSGSWSWCCASSSKPHKANFQEDHFVWEHSQLNLSDFCFSNRYGHTGQIIQANGSKQTGIGFAASSALTNAQNMINYSNFHSSDSDWGAMRSVRRSFNCKLTSGTRDKLLRAG